MLVATFLEIIHKLKSPDNSYSCYFSPLSTATHLLRGGGEGGGGGEEVEEVAHQAGHLLRGDPPAVVPVEHPGRREGEQHPHLKIWRSLQVADCPNRGFSGTFVRTNVKTHKLSHP